MVLSWLNKKPRKIRIFSLNRRTGPAGTWRRRGFRRWEPTSKEGPEQLPGRPPSRESPACNAAHCVGRSEAELGESAVFVPAALPAPRGAGRPRALPHIPAAFARARTCTPAAFRHAHPSQSRTQGPGAGQQRPGGAGIDMRAGSVRLRARALPPCTWRALSRAQSHGDAPPYLPSPTRTHAVRTVQLDCNRLEPATMIANLVATLRREERFTSRPW